VRAALGPDPTSLAGHEGDEFGQLGCLRFCCLQVRRVRSGAVGTVSAGLPGASFIIHISEGEGGMAVTGLGGVAGGNPSLSIYKVAWVFTAERGANPLSQGKLLNSSSNCLPIRI
jgi:hypothetical protein